MTGWTEETEEKLTEGKYVSPPSSTSLKYISTVAILWPPRFKLNYQQGKNTSWGSLIHKH